MKMDDQFKNIELTDKGFRITSAGQVEAEFDWPHVTEIVAYRRDPEGADLLCLGFRASASKEYVELDEETDGYSQLLPALYDAFPEIRHDWWQEVAGPMGTNRQTIYGMAMSSEDEEPAANKYLKSLHLQRKLQRQMFKNTLIMLLFGAALGIGAGRGLAENKWRFLVINGVFELVMATILLRRIKPVLLAMAVFALFCWITVMLAS